MLRHLVEVSLYATDVADGVVVTDDSNVAAIRAELDSLASALCERRKTSTIQQANGPASDGSLPGLAAAREARAALGRHVPASYPAIPE